MGGPLGADAQAILRSVQGGILQPHGRPHGSLLFLELGDAGSGPGVRRWLQGLFATRVRSAWDELQPGGADQPLMAIHLSASGYEKLGIAAPSSSAFREGMVARGQRLADPPVSTWETAYRESDLDLLILLADREAPRLARAAVDLRNDAAALGARVVIQEVACQLRRNGEDIEHFGFVDGISQPVFLPGGGNHADGQPVSSLDIVLTEHPPASGQLGSYLVVRKLEQNVAGWAAMVIEVAEALGTTEEEASALVMGRCKDGSPLLTPHARGTLGSGSIPPRDDFDYATDPLGRYCPFNSHVRKMNPRSGGKARRIVRRSITYGLRPDLHPAGAVFGPPARGVGLFFLCYQADIENQFEILQREHANGRDTPFPGAGADLVIGQGDESLKLTHPTAATDGSSPGELVSLPLERYVKLRGGGYFHAPGMGIWQCV